MRSGKSFYKSSILTDRRDFALLFEKGHRKNHRNLQVIALREQGGAERLRFAVCVSVRCGNSVQRNRLKRILRVAVLETLPLLEKGWIVAVLPRGNTKGLKMQDVLSQFRSLCHQMHLFGNGTHA